MAATDLESSDIKKQDEVEDITTCCICTEVYTDPKALPCIHTFCMKCIQETGLKTNKGPGDEMPCPICRRLFRIPQDGFPGLPKHFFIERLIQVSKRSDSSAVSRALCSVCSLEESKDQTGKETPKADTYCVDCKHKLCEECCSEHRKFKATKNHKLIPISGHEISQNVLTDQAPSLCEVHEQKILDVYCADCKTVACAICFIEEHSNHKGSHVDKCVVGFRKQIENTTEAMNECISQAQIKKTQLTKVKEEIQQKVDSLEYDVLKRKDNIKQLADKNASSLLQGLCSERQSKLKEIQMAADETDAYLSNLESYKTYCQGIMEKGSASDICSALSGLSARAMELQQECQPMMERGSQELKFCFRQSELEEFLAEDCGNLLGEIEEEGGLKPKKGSKQILLAEKSKETDILRKKNEDLRQEKVDYKAHVEKLKQELENNKTTIIELQDNNDKLRKDLRTSNGKYLEELNRYKASVNTLKTNAKKLRKELETAKADKLESLYKPRLCHAKKRDDGEGFGFNVEAHKGKTDQFIGKVDPGSPAEAAGLRVGDRLVEVNGVNVENDSHTEVVRRIKLISNETKLLVIENEGYEYYRARGVVVTAGMLTSK